MRLVTYRTAAGLRSGVIVDDTVLDIARLMADTGNPLRSSSVRSILSAGVEALAALRKRLADDGSDAAVGHVDDITLGPPVPDAGKIVCIGLNYKAHANESNRDIPPYPSIFGKYANSLVGPLDRVFIPPIEDPQVDYEGELAVVIGQRASRVSVERALDHVAGVSVMNDLTARRLQYETSQWMLGKAIDGFGPMGPALVTLDEIDDIQNLSLRTRVNGNEVQSANTSTMIWSVAELLAIITETITLEPGDIIATGTPAGIGYRRTPQLLLGDGDVVEVEIDGVGLIRNVIVGNEEMKP